MCEVALTKFKADAWMLPTVPNIKDGSGVVEPSDIMGVYDTSQHPDVIKGTKTPDQVLAEFLETFEVGVGFRNFTALIRNFSDTTRSIRPLNSEIYHRYLISVKFQAESDNLTSTEISEP